MHVARVTGEFDRMAVPDHPDRQSAQLEIHARPIIPIPAPCRIRRVALQFSGGARGSADAQKRFLAWHAAHYGPTDGDARRLGYESADRKVVWELHTEFMTFTWVGAITDPEPWPVGIDSRSSKTKKPL
jgi:uncharacterized membrane-anchored protein